MEEKKDLSPIPEELDHAPEKPAPKSSSGYFIGTLFCLLLGSMFVFDDGGFISTAPIGLSLIAIGLLLACLGFCRRFSD